MDKSKPDQKPKLNQKDQGLGKKAKIKTDGRATKSEVVVSSKPKRKPEAEVAKLSVLVTPPKRIEPQPLKANKIKPVEEVVAVSSERELLYYGRHICTTLSGKRRDDIIRVYCTEETLAQFGPLLRWCSQNKKAYHVVADDEMQRVTHSVHHEGIAILARTPDVGDAADLLDYLQKKPGFPLVLVDGVQNPHNLGIIMRVLASFGWPVVVGGAELPALSGAAARMSEGGSEFVRAFRCQDLSQFIGSLKDLGYSVIGTSSRAKKSIYEADLPAKVAWVIGSEVHGIAAATLPHLDEECAIPSSGQVESLNVAVACGLLLGEYTRRHGLGSGECREI